MKNDNNIVGKLPKDLKRRVSHFKNLLKLTEEQEKTLSEWYFLNDKYMPWVIILALGFPIFIMGLDILPHSGDITTLEDGIRLIGYLAFLMAWIYAMGYSGWKVLKNYERTIRWKERRGIYD